MCVNFFSSTPALKQLRLVIMIFFKGAAEDEEIWVVAISLFLKGTDEDE